MTKIRCESCGREYPDEQLYCSNCGKRIIKGGAEAVATSSTRKSFESFKVWFERIAYVIVTIFVMSIVVYGISESLEGKTAETVNMLAGIVLLFDIGAGTIFLVIGGLVYFMLYVMQK